MPEQMRMRGGRGRNPMRKKALKYSAAKRRSLRSDPKVRTPEVQRKKDRNVRRSSKGKWETAAQLNEHERNARPKRNRRGR